MTPLRASRPAAFVMPQWIQFSPSLRPWRFVSLGCATALIVVGFRFLLTAGSTPGIGAAGPAALGMACFVSAGIFIAPAIVGVVASPVTRLLGDLFCPTEALTAPPEPLLRSLRQRLQDRHWQAVEQQVDALLLAYGPRAELFYLRAHLVAGQTGRFETVTAEAVSALRSREFDRYAALLRRDPPPTERRVGIDA